MDTTSSLASFSIGEWEAHVYAPRQIPGTTDHEYKIALSEHGEPVAVTWKRGNLGAACRYAFELLLTAEFEGELPEEVRS